jgi:hypothetical protein
MKAARFCPGYDVAQTCDGRCAICKHVILVELPPPGQSVTIPAGCALLDLPFPVLWFRDGPERIDPIKEASAEERRLRDNENTTTLADIYARKGQDWETLIRRLVRERARRKRRRRGWGGSRRSGGARTIRRRMTAPGHSRAWRLD